MNSTSKELAHGVMYTAVAKYAGIVVTLVVAGVLSRMLPPEDFGVVAVASVVIAFFAIFSDLGISPAIIQHSTLTRIDLDNIFTFTLWSGVVLSLMFFAGSWWVAEVYDSPQMVIICQLLSINLFFASANIVPSALLYKEKRFRFIAIRSLIIQTLCGVLAVGTVFAGAGILALLVAPIVSSVVIFVVNYRQYPLKIRLSWGVESLKKIFSYSMYQFLFNLINYFSRNADKLLIGKYMGMVPLGYYEKSYRLMMLPLQNITHVISPVMHPVFAKFQNDMQALSDSYVKVVRLLAFIGFPLSALLYFTAREATLIIFGGQWEASVPVFQILALSVGVQIILSTSGAIFQAANSTKVLFYSGLCSSVLNVAGILVGIFVFRSLTAVAWAIVVTFSINFIQCYVLMYLVTLKISMRRFWVQLVSPLVLSVLVAAVLWGVAVATNGVPMLWSAMIKGVVAVVMSVAYVQLTGEYNIWGKIKSIIKL